MRFIGYRRHEPPPTAYPYGTILRHRATPFAGDEMHSLKGMVVGPATIQHPQRIQIVRVSGHDIGDLDDVYVDSWEPVDG